MNKSAVIAFLLLLFLIPAFGELTSNVNNVKPQAHGSCIQMPVSPASCFDPSHQMPVMHLPCAAVAACARSGIQKKDGGSRHIFYFFLKDLLLAAFFLKEKTAFQFRRNTRFVFIPLIILVIISFFFVVRAAHNRSAR